MRGLVARATTLVVSIGAAAAFAENRDSRLVAWVELGPDGQAIARAITSERRCPVIRLDHRDPAFVNYQDELRQVEALAAANPNALSIWANHHPLLAFSPVTGNIVTGGNPALLSVMYATYATQYYPPGIDLQKAYTTRFVDKRIGMEAKR